MLASGIPVFATFGFATASVVPVALEGAETGAVDIFAKFWSNLLAVETSVFESFPLFYFALPKSSPGGRKTQL